MKASGCMPFAESRFRSDTAIASKPAKRPAQPLQNRQAYFTLGHCTPKDA